MYLLTYLHTYGKYALNEHVYNVDEKSTTAEIIHLKKVHKLVGGDCQPTSQPEAK